MRKQSFVNMAHNHLHTAESMWSYGAQNTSRCGLDDQLSKTSSMFIGCIYVKFGNGPLWMTVSTRSERGLPVSHAVLSLQQNPTYILHLGLWFSICSPATCHLLNKSPVGQGCPYRHMVIKKANVVHAAYFDQNRVE